MAAPKNRGLGKGLDALFSSSEIKIPTESANDAEQLEERGISFIYINDIKPNEKQPRKNFDEEKLE